MATFQVPDKAEDPPSLHRASTTSRTWTKSRDWLPSPWITSLPGPGFFEGSDTDPTKLTSGYEYDLATEMEKAFGLHKLVLRNEDFSAIQAGT